MDGALVVVLFILKREQRTALKVFNGGKDVLASVRIKLGLVHHGLPQVSDTHHAPSESPILLPPG